MSSNKSNIKRFIEDIKNTDKSINNETSGLENVFSEELTEEKLFSGDLNNNPQDDHSLDNIYFYDFQGNFIYANNNVLNMLGYSKDEISQLNFSSLLTEDQLPMALKRLKDIKEKGAVNDLCEFKLKKKDGDYIWIETKGSLISNSGENGIIKGRAREITERKKVELSLQESENMYRRLVESVEDIIYTSDDKGNYKYMNPSGLKKLGYSYDELVSMNYRDLIPQEYSSDAEEFYIKQSGKEQVETYYEIPWIKKDGTLIWIGQNARLINVEGKAEYYCVARDITKLRKSSEALRESEEKYRNILESIKEGYFEVDIKGNVLFFNKAMREILERPEEEILNLNYKDCVSEENTKMLFNQFSHIYRTGERIENIFFNLKLKSGKVKQLELSVGLIFDINGNTIAFRCVIRDVTTREKAIEAIRRDEQKYSEFVESLPEIVFKMDTEGNFIYVNRKTLDLLGYTPSEIIGLNATSFAMKQECERTARLIKELRSGKNIEGEKLRFLKKDGSTLPIQIYANVIYEDNKIIGSKGIAVNITDQMNPENALREKEGKFQTLVENCSESMAIIDSGGIIQYETESVKAKLGYSPEEIIGKNVFDLIHEEDRETLAKIFFDDMKNNRTSGLTGAADYRIRHKDGSWRHMSTVSSNLLDNPVIDNPVIEVIVINARDITKRKHAEEALRLSEDKYRKLYENAIVGMITVRISDRKIIAANDFGCKMFGFSTKEMFVEKTVMSDLCIDSLIREEIFSILEIDNEIINYESQFRKKDGSIFWGELSARKYTELGKIEIIIIDISKMKKIEKQIYNLTFYDKLTRLPNKEMFKSCIKTEILKAESRKQGNIFAVICIGIDRFKYINSVFGSIIGDSLLKEVGKRLSEAVYEMDAVSRFEGDRFMILFSDIATRDDVGELVKKISNIFFEPIFIEGEKLKITFSMGVCLYPKDGSNPEMLTKNSEAAMYMAKDSSIDTCFYDAELNVQILNRFVLEKELQAAIVNNEFEVYYQPKVGIIRKDGKKDFVFMIDGMESLIRWNSPKRGMVLPYSFIPLAEKSGMIIDIGYHILHKSCEQNKKWQDMGYYPVRVAVNLSPHQIGHPELINNIENIINMTGLAPKWLELEITESGIVENEKENIETLKQLRDFGFTIAIDDFGTGHSSLSKIQNYPIDTIKIDKSFIDNIVYDDKAASIIKYTINLAHDLGFGVIAEGVETKEQLDFLVEHECDQIQGYYFSKPLPSDEFEKKLN